MYLLNHETWTPYLGKSVWQAFVGVNSSTSTLSNTQYTLVGDTENVFTYQLKAWVSYAVKNNLDVFFETSF